MADIPLQLGLAPPDLTRLADLTGLDRLGLPVWQAVRPLGRSLSCHLGKGMTEEQAIVSALGEARECFDCETFQPERILCGWEDLPAAGRPAAPDDFAVARSAVGPGDAIGWSLVEGLAGPDFYVPTDSICIDFTRTPDRGVLCATDGQATASGFDQAVRRALLERIERDAVACFRSLPAGERLAWSVDPATVELGWFQALLEQCRSLGMVIGLHRLPAIGNLPAFQLSITETGAPDAACRLTGGWGAGFTTEAALQAALLEAAQSRAAHIAGARDDMEPGPAPPLEQPALPFARGRRRFVTSGEEPESDAVAVGKLAGMLAAAGFSTIGYVVTSASGNAFTTVKAFVPGLAQDGRARRA